MPTLTRTGLAALSGLAALVLGAGLTAHPLLALSAVIAGALMLGAYASLALLLFELRRERLEFTWQLAGGVEPIAGGHADLVLSLRNRSAFSWRSIKLDVLGSPTLIAPEDASVDVPARSIVSATLRLQTPRAGYWVAHGAVLELEDAGGLFRMAPYCARRLAIRVHPAPCAQHTIRLSSGATGGSRMRRQRGLGSDIREIREHRHGDPFRSIAWKATARRGRLMVREFETDVRVPLVIALDCSPSMRLGPLGAAPLDEAVRCAAGFARSLLRAGDPVGFVAFSSRRLASVACGADGTAMQRIEDALLQVCATLPTEDVMDGRVGQLRAMARFLAKEAALRVHPSLLVPGDAELVLEVGKRALEKLQRRGVIDHVPDNDDARIALFLWHHGLLPDSAPPELWAPRERGLLDAIDFVAADAARPRVCLVLSDLRGVRDRALLSRKLARHSRTLRVAIAVPHLPRGGLHDEESRLWALAESRERQTTAAHLIKARATVLFATPETALDAVAAHALDATR